MYDNYILARLVQEETPPSWSDINSERWSVQYGTAPRRRIPASVPEAIQDLAALRVTYHLGSSIRYPNADLTYDTLLLGNQMAYEIEARLSHQRSRVLWGGEPMHYSIYGGDTPSAIRAYYARERNYVIADITPTTESEYCMLEVAGDSLGPLCKEICPVEEDDLHNRGIWIYSLYIDGINIPPGLYSAREKQEKAVEEAKWERYRAPKIELNSFWFDMHMPTESPAYARFNQPNRRRR